MYRLFCLLIILASSTFAYGQNVLSSKEMVSITPAVAEEIDLPTHAKKILSQKLTQVVTQNGFGAVGGNIVLTANMLVTDAQTTATAPPMTVINVEVSLALLDVGERVVLNEMSISVRGIDNSVDRALIKATNAINPRMPDVRNFMNECRGKVIDYYTTRIPALMAKSKSLADREEFDEAMAVLAVIPESCDEYPAVADQLVTIFTKKVDREAEPLFMEAQAHAGRGMYLEAVGALLRVSPSATRYSEVSGRISAIQAQASAEEQARIAAEWELYMAQITASSEATALAAEQAQRDSDAQMTLELEKIAAAKEIAISSSTTNTTSLKTIAKGVSDWLLGSFK